MSARAAFAFPAALYFSMYVDSHAHLEGNRFDPDRREVFRRAKSAGVEAVLLIGSGTGPGSLDCAIQLTREFGDDAEVPQLYASIGIHPHEAKLAEEKDFAEMAAFAKQDRVIGWGEIGLDYFYDHSPRDVQQRVFRRQMEQARETKLPIIIHCRPSNADPNDAWDDTLRLIREDWAPSGLCGILHCFTGEVEHMRAALEMGFMISFAGNVSFPKGENIRRAAAEVPLERMLIETDSPFLAPVPNRGKRNEPAFVVETARHIAQLRGVPPEDIGRATTQNFYRFFSLSEKINGVTTTHGL
jgi:TatD DNase family protein